METTIPFQGFYCSEYSELVDYAVTNCFQDDHGDINQAIADKVFDNTDYRALHEYAAKAYTEYFAFEFKIKLTFKELVSPREYNFTTDRIFCDIDLEEVKRIYELVDHDILVKQIKDNFTSYDGFISHYSNDLDSWGSDLAEWDHNQIGTLLEAYAKQELDSANFEIYELREEIENNVGNYIKDFEKYYKIARYLNDRQYRESIV